MRIFPLAIFLNHIKIKPFFVIPVLTLLASATLIMGCKKALIEEMNTMDFPTLLSEHKIFAGTMSELVPTADFHLYELSSTLFTDHAEKQRLVFVPENTRLEAVDNNLVNFPEGTILVKTFYYFIDKRQPSLGKKIQETRLLVKKNDGWQVATYRWNEAQSDAQLLTVGYSQPVNWLDENGVGHAITYAIPSNNACVTCHNQSGKVMPIGPKVQNWNRAVVRNSDTLNQLTHLSNLGILNTVNPSDYFSLPDYSSISLDEITRARAYFEVNCAHCHNPDGYASDKKVNFLFATPVHDMGLGPHASHLGGLLDKGKMPKLGTTTVDTAGVRLMRKFIDNL